ncbi:MAG: iron-containing alcohol dehydrogenase [Bacteroidales bacterium]
MKNFEFYNPVRILFGQGAIGKISAFIPADVPVLFTYGGGSIKRNGVYQQVAAALEGHRFIEFPGIQPNPAYEQLMPALELIREHRIGFILAVGGGSVIDGSKFIAAAAHYQGEDPWDILLNKAPVVSALPLGAVLTLPATGTEMNANAVVTREGLGQKLAFGSPWVMPRFSALDPEVTYSLPKNQIANGVVDAFIHVLEQYLTYPSQAEVQDRFAESLLMILKDTGSKVFASEEPVYADRANFMWAATNALNSSLSMGVVTDWTTHTLGHELTALYGLDHAVTLAIILPGVMKVTAERRKEKMLQYAERIWGITSFDHQAAIDEAIRYTEQFFRCLGIKTRLSEYQIGAEVIDRVLENLRSRNVARLGNARDLTIEEVPAILESRL